MDEIEALFTVTDFVFSLDQTDTSLSVVCSGKFFHISFDSQDLGDSASVREQYLHYLEVAEAIELEDETVEDFYDWVLEPFLPIFEQIPPLDVDQTFLLNDYLFPTYMYYSLRASGDRLVPIPTDVPKFTPSDTGTDLSREDCLQFPLFHPHQVEIHPDFFRQSEPGVQKRVIINGNLECFFKSYMPGDTLLAQREIQTYKKIEDAGLEPDLRISRLHGVVWDDSHETIYGLLLTYIDCGNLTLACAVDQDTPSELRKSWATQIESLVGRLHEADLLWGDVKPDNVLIDKDEKAWLVDFGGGYTEGWVDESLTGTKEGDLQGLALILEYLDTKVESME